MLHGERLPPGAAPRPVGAPQAHLTPLSSPCQAGPNNVRTMQAHMAPPAPSIPQMLRPAGASIPQGWINASFTAAPQGYMAPPASMPNMSTYSTVPASGSAAAPPGAGPRCQVRVQPRMSAGCQASPALTSPRRPGSPSKLQSAEAAAMSKSSRMRYSSGRAYDKSTTATVLTTQHEASVQSLTASKPVKSGSRCYRSSSCSSDLDGNSPRRGARGAFERAHSAGVRMETPGSLSRGAASSTALLLEANGPVGPVRRSSAGNLPYSNLSRQRSGRRPGSKSPPSPPRTGQGVSRRPSGGTQPHSSRGTPGRKSTVSIVVAGGSIAPGPITEPEAEAEPSRQVAKGQLENYQNLSAAAHAARRAAQDPSPVVPRPAQVRDLGQSPGSQLQLFVSMWPSEIVHWKDIQGIQLISGGSFGEVYSARLAGQKVCVKRCLTGPGGAMTPEQLRNLQREINAYRKINNLCEQIVKYIGCVLEAPNLAIVTEFLTNGNLFDLLYVNQVSLKAALRVKAAIQTSQAIQYMHGLKPPLVHRDLKTQNLVLDKQFNIKVCDFGKTQELLGGVTITHQDTGGSPRYMAPECFVVGSCITEKVDIWSLGCCLVEILGGPLPYENLPMMSEVQNRLKQGIPPMVPPWFTPNSRPMLHKCFQFDPARRIDISEILLTLKGLTPQDLERCGMDVRRIN